MINGINHITLAVSDVESSFIFYTTILGLTPVARWGKGAYLSAGSNWIALNEDKSIKKSYRPDYSHIAFTCSGSDFKKLRERILQSGYPEWSENSSEGDSLYFQDPDGHKLEIHIGDLNTRLEEMHNNPWDTFTFF